MQVYIYIYIHIECNLGERSGVAHVEIGALWVGEKNPGDPEGRRKLQETQVQAGSISFSTFRTGSPELWPWPAPRSGGS